MVRESENERVSLEVGENVLENEADMLASKLDEPLLESGTMDTVAERECDIELVALKLEDSVLDSGTAELEMEI